MAASRPGTMRIIGRSAVAMTLRLSLVTFLEVDLLDPDDLDVLFFDEVVFLEPVETASQSAQTLTFSPDTFEETDMARTLVLVLPQGVDSGCAAAAPFAPSTIKANAAARNLTSIVGG